MKKALAFLIVAAMLAVLCLGAQALELETVETAAVPNDTLTVTSELAGAIENPATYIHPTYGKLIYYNDFEDGTTNATYIDTSILKGLTIGGNNTRSIVDDPIKENNKVLKNKYSYTTTGNYPYVNLSFTEKLTTVGVYYLVADVYTPSDITTKNIDYLRYTNGIDSNVRIKDGAFTYGSWDYDHPSQGISVVAEVGTNLINSFDKIYICNCAATGNTENDYFMVDNIRLYYNMPRVTYDVNLPAGQSAAKRMNITSDSSSDFTTTSESVKVGTAAPVLFIPGYTFLGWYNEQGERVSTITEQAKLTAQWAEVKPGLNTLTGTTEAETFESAEEGDRPSTITVPNFSDYKIVSVNNLAIGETAITGNDGSTKALRAEVIPNVAYYKTDSEGNQVLDSNGNPILTGESYPHFFILNNMENGRSYHFSFKIFSDAIFKNNVADHLWLMKAGVGDAYIDLGEVFRTNNKSYKWYSDTRTFAWDNTGENRINMQFRTQYKYGTTDKQPMYFYLDDVMLVPYYKITYKNTDGTEIETVQYLEFGSDGKPLTTYTPKKTNYPENIPGADGKSVQVCIGWATTENATVPETSISLANADIVLYPVWKTIELEDNTYGTLIYYNDFNGYQSTTAGNLKTGHTYVGGILKGNTVALNGGNANLSIAIDPADTTKSNQVLQITSTNNYARADLKFGTHLENFGNYTIIMDVYVPSANTTANINALVYINDNTSTHSVYSFNAKERDAWNANKAAGSFQVVQAGDHGAANSGKGKCFDNVYLCDRRASIPTGSVFYIDNLRLYYKPTCRVAYDYGAYTAEQVGGKAYQYLTTGVSVDTNNSLSLSNTGLTLAGWSKTKPAAEGTPDLVTSITDADIEEKEITLYAVWGEPSAAYAVSADNTVAFGKSDTTVTVTANHLTDWTCDTGYSDAEVTTTDTTLTVKAVGYSGVVTVTARSKLDGTEQTVKVFLICGNLQKPGLNVMTGTAYSEDFAEEARMMFTKTDTSFNMAWTSEAPEGTTGNDSASFVKVWGTKTGINADEYVRFFIPVPTESGRKYDVTFDTYSKVNISGDGVPENYEYMDYVGWLLDFREKDPANPNDDGHITFKNSDIYSATKAGTWYHHEYIDKEARHEDSSNISMQFKVSPNSANNPTGTADGTYRTDFEFYIDNLSVIPYYKVTYHIPTGEGELTYDDYFLPTDDNNFTPNSEYCPAACLYKVGMDGDWQSSDTPYQLTHEDIDVYVGTKTLTEHSIRVASTEAAQALRFSGSVSNEIIKGNQNTDIFEFGFIVSRSDFMIAAAKKSDVDETAYKTLLTFEGANVSTESANGVYVNGKGLPFVYGPSYRILNGKPEKQQITSNDQASFFTAALTGIPETYYKTPICGRTYVKIGEVYYYGEVEETSVYAVAWAYSQTDAYKNLPEGDPTKVAIDAILSAGSTSGSETSGTSET